VQATGIGWVRKREREQQQLDFFFGIKLGALSRSRREREREREGIAARCTKSGRLCWWLLCCIALRFQCRKGNKILMLKMEIGRPFGIYARSNIDILLYYKPKINIRFFCKLKVKMMYFVALVFFRTSAR
jgi:hypothetical protein